MSLYYSKFMLEEGLDSVQDPDNTGVDLDQIEDDIVGDGNEAHSEEIEAAVDGVIEEPLEEAFMIMYESESNYNKLLQSIGIHELQEAAHGREYILEAGDIRAFFDKVAAIIKKMFESITKAFRNVLVEMRSMNVGDRQLVERHKKAITDGASKLSKDSSKFKATVYEYPDKEFKTSDTVISGYLNGCEQYISNGTKLDNIMNKEGMKTAKTAILKKYIGNYNDVESISDLQKKLEEELRGDEVSNPFGNIKKYTDILSADKEGGQLTKDYYKVKDSYKDALNRINKMKKDGLKSHKDDEDKSARTNISTVANFYSTLIRFRQNCLNSVFTVYMKAARKKRSQARAIVKACISAANSKKAVGESAYSHSSIFSNIQFV